MGHSAAALSASETPAAAPAVSAYQLDVDAFCFLGSDHHLAVADVDLHRTPEEAAPDYRAARAFAEAHISEPSPGFAAHAYLAHYEFAALSEHSHVHRTPPEAGQLSPSC